MEKADFLEQVDGSTQQVFVMQTRACFPFSLFVHTYLVVNNHGTLSRWDVWHKKGVGGKSAGHVHRDSALPWDGISVFYFGNLFAHPLRFRPQILHVFDGADAATLKSTLEQKAFQYRYKDVYHFIGPNSNTFAAWILRHITHGGDMLSWNALGKNYKK